MSFAIPAGTSNPTLFPIFPVFAGLGFVLPLIPLTWHLQAWNSGTCYYMIWASVACLNQFVNSLVWHGNFENPAPIWCEISIRIIMGASVGLPASSLCINRRLYQIASVKTGSVTRSDKIRTIIIDTLICVLFPLVFIALQYVVQGHRFNIFEDYGCYPALYNTLLGYFITSMWPIVIGLISAVYCTLSLISLARRRAEFAQFLSSHSGMNVSRYFRLMALAMTEMLMTVPLAAFTIWLNTVATTISPWRSWEDTHLNFSRVERYPALLFRQNHLFVVALELSRWLNPLCAFVFFAYFGFAQEARKNYRAAFYRVMKLVYPSYGEKNTHSTSTSVKLPSYVAKDAPRTPPILPVYDTKRPVSIATSFTRSFRADMLSKDALSISVETPSPTASSKTFQQSQRDSLASFPTLSYHDDLEGRRDSAYSGPRAI